MRRFLVARREGDFERVRNLYSMSEYFRGIGTGEDEWIDAETFQSIVQSDWDTYEIANDEILQLEAFENGETGWVALEAERKAAWGYSWTYRLTVVFVLEQGVWRAIQTHFSAPVDDTVLMGPELTGTLSNLVESIGEPIVGQRTRTATVVFTDIVGSTSLSESMGDETWSTTVGRHFDDLRTIVEDQGGRVIKTLGDGGMFIFDAASAALRSAAAISEANADGPLPLRIGIHTGDLVAGDGDVLGATVAKAARVTAAADGGQVLVSATTAGMANPTEFTFGPPISLELKGLAGTHVVHELR
jgi:adenylate cyclase